MTKCFCPVPEPSEDGVKCTRCGGESPKVSNSEPAKKKRSKKE
jgi:hypothetical protein